MRGRQETYKSKYYSENREKCQARFKKYYEDNKEIIKKRCSEHNKRNKEKYNIMKLERNRKKRVELLEFLSGWPPTCQLCGYNKDVRCLQVDHINGGGTQERKKLKAQQLINYYYIHPSEAKNCLRVLCANCNWIERMRLGVGLSSNL